MADLANIDVVDSVDVYDVPPLLPVSLANIDLLVAAGDVDPPDVSVAPAAGSSIGSTQALAVTVTDDAALRRVVILAEYASRPEEVVFNGVGFGRLFAGSTTSPTTGGTVYTVRRLGGWPTSPTLRVLAIDTSGNEG